MPNISDENLVKLVQDGDAEQFGLLIERYEAKMLRYAGKFLFDPDNAKDLVQEVFIKAYINIAGFNTDKRFSPWLYRIAHNCFINEIKKKNRALVMSFDADIFIPQFFAKDNPEREILDDELRNSLDASLNKIDVKYKEALILFFYEGLSYKEIADILHIPVNAVGVRICRGKMAIKKILKV